MDSIRIDILNPKAKELLKSLVDLDLIAIRDFSGSGFSKLLDRLRAKETIAPTLDEITREVEAVRNKRYGKVSD